MSSLIRTFSLPFKVHERLDAFLHGHHYALLLKHKLLSPGILEPLDARGYKLADYAVMRNLLSIPAHVKFPPANLDHLNIELSTYLTAASPTVVRNFDSTMRGILKANRKAIKDTQQEVMTLSASKLVTVLLTFAMDTLEGMEGTAQRGEDIKRNNGSTDGHAGQTTNKSAKPKTRRSVAA